MKKVLLFLLVIGLLTFSYSFDTSTGNPYKGHLGGEHPNMFTSILYFSSTATNNPDKEISTTTPKPTSMEYSFSLDGKIDGTGAVHSATSLLELQHSSNVADKEKSIFVDPLVISNDQCNITLQFKKFGATTFEPTQIRLSVILIDENFNGDSTGSYVYARNSKPESVDTTGTHQFDFESEAGNDSPFDYVPNSNTDGCGAMKDSNGNFLLETNCGHTRFYTFVTGFRVNNDATNEYFPAAQLKASGTTSCAPAAKGNTAYPLQPQISTIGSVYIFKESSTDTGIGLWICYTAVDIGTPIVHEIQISFIFIGLRDFTYDTYPTQAFSSADNFAFYSMHATGDSNQDPLKFKETIDDLVTTAANYKDVTTQNKKRFKGRQLNYAHLFCGHDSILTASKAIDPILKIDTTPGTPIGQITLADNQFSTQCVMFEKSASTVCSPDNKGIGALTFELTDNTTKSTSGDFTSDISSVTAATEGANGVQLKTVAYFKVDAAKASTAQIQINFDLNSVTTTEFFLYVEGSTSVTTGEKAFNVTWADTLLNQKEKVIASGTTGTAVEQLIHSSDKSKNKLIIDYRGPIVTSKITYFEVSLVGFEKVMDEGVCSTKCSEKTGFTIGVDVTTSPPNCVKCETALFKEFKSGKCQCIEHYYLDSDKVCQPCLGSLCATCQSSSTDCLTCVGNATKPLASGVCTCDDGFYQNAGECSPCNVACTTCTSTTSCSECAVSTNSDNVTTRDVASKGCVCLSGFYEAGEVVCPSCSSRCLTCSGTADNCSTCDQANNFVPSENSCKCKDGYYEFLNEGVITCKVCDSSCATCVTSSINCVTCPPFRVKAGVAGQTGVYKCECQSGFIEIQGSCASTNCTEISTFCQTCSFVLNTDQNVCTACIDNRIVINNKCECKPSFYEKAGTCTQCGTGCQSCSTEGTTCTTCAIKATNNGDGTCACPFGTVLEKAAGTFFCQNCHITCASCSDTFTNCTTCNSGYIHNPTTKKCDCPSGTYKSDLGQCASCIPNCITCTSAQNCMTCAQFYNYDETSNSCVINCPSGTYKSGVECKACPSECVECTSPFICTSCQAGLTIYAGSCRQSCPPGTIQINSQCFSCQYPCETCSVDVNKCDSCVKPFIYFNGNCVDDCQPGTYYAGSSCLSCSSQCLTCSGTSSRCTSCPSNQFLFQNTCLTSCPYAIVNGVCTDKCPDGQFLSSNSCQQCDTQCMTCTGTASSCTSCSSGHFSHLGNCVSSCPHNNFASGSSCFACDSSCNGCTGNRLTCTSCAPGFFRSGSRCVPNCGDGFYLDSSNNCQPCSTGCKVCTSNFCISCTDPSLTPINGVCRKSCPTGASLVGETCICQIGSMHQNTCLTACPNGFYSRNKVCEQCSSSCKTCSLLSTSCTSCHSGFVFNPASRTCSQTSPCSFGEYEDLTGVCVRICQSGFYYKGVGCIAFCPGGYVNNNHGACVESTSPTFCASPLFRQGNSCVNNCQSGFWGNTQTRVCELCESSCQLCLSLSFCFSCKSGFVKNPTTGICEVSAGCQPGQIQYENKCFSQCPIGTYAVSQTCLRACPVNTYFYINANGDPLCYPSCPTGLRTPDACVLTCPPNTNQIGTACSYI